MRASGALEGLTRIVEKDELGNESESSGVDSEEENNKLLIKITSLSN